MYTHPRITKSTRTHTHTLNPHYTHTNTLQIPHFHTHTHPLLALYQHLEHNTTKCISHYRSCICQRYIDWSRTFLLLCKVLLARSQVVRCTRIAKLMIRKSHTTHSHCRKAGNLVELTDDEHMICHHWYFLVSLQFPKILFQMVNHPKMNTTAIFYVVFFFYLLRTTWFT